MTERKQISLQKDDTQAALEFALTRTNKRLEVFKEYNSGIPEKDLMREFAQNEGVYWEDLEPIINAAKDQLDQYRKDINADAQAALDALDELDADQDYLFGRVAVDGSVAGAMAKSVRDKLKTIRAALTAQLTKTDDNVSCPRVANTGDINAELLEALDDKNLMEILAEIEHERWSGWMRYQLEVINDEKIHHWKNLMNTHYSDLEEWSKESDRREARNTLEAIKKFITTARAEQKGGE